MVNLNKGGESFRKGISIEIIGGIGSAAALGVVAALWRERATLLSSGSKGFHEAWLWLSEPLFLPRWVAYLLWGVAAGLVLTWIRGVWTKASRDEDEPAGVMAIRNYSGTFIPNELELHLLRQIANSSPTPVYEANLVRREGETPLHTEEALARLAKMGLIERYGGYGRPLQYGLTSDGRSYAIQSNLV